MSKEAYRWWTFAVVSMALFMGMLDNLVVTTALPTIQRALGASVANLEWIVNAYTLGFAMLMIPAAALGERFGRRRQCRDGQDAALCIGRAGCATRPAPRICQAQPGTFLPGTIREHEPAPAIEQEQRLAGMPQIALPAQLQRRVVHADMRRTRFVAPP